MFIGREKELQFLQECYDSPKAQLVVLYGRRRVGKTETLREFCKGKPHVFYSCTQSQDGAQLARFSRQMMREDIPAKQYVSVFADWESAFHSIIDLPYGDKKKLLVVDEFPYMCKGNKSIPSILQELWDTELKDQNIMLVLCGSSMSFIEKELLAEKNPLYGRATGIYKMTEMGFYDAMRFFPNYSALDKVFTYATLGGIPHYLNQFDPNRPVADNIKKAILTKGSVLYSEVDFLLHQELRETPVYNAIIEAVALGNTRLNDISQMSLVDDTKKTSVYLKNLMELGIVSRELSVDAGQREKSNSSRGTYRLTDNFFRFWYAFGFANISQLEDGDVEGVYRYMVEPNLHQFASFVFEDICREFMRELQKRGRLPFWYTKMGRWTGKTTVRDLGARNGLRLSETEIDLLAIGQGAKQYLVGECKFRKSPFSFSDYLDTVAKLTTQKGQAEFFYALFSESGFEPKVQAEASDHVFLYSLDKIINLERPETNPAE